VASANVDGALLKVDGAHVEASSPGFNSPASPKNFGAGITKGIAAAAAIVKQAE